MTLGPNGVLTVTEVRTDDAGKAWDRYVQDHPLASGYHLLAWGRVVEKACGHRTARLFPPSSAVRSDESKRRR